MESQFETIKIKKTRKRLSLNSEICEEPVFLSKTFTPSIKRIWNSKIAETLKLKKIEKRNPPIELSPPVKKIKKIAAETFELYDEDNHKYVDFPVFPDKKLNFFDNLQNKFTSLDQSTTSSQEKSTQADDDCQTDEKILTSSKIYMETQIKSAIISEN